MYRTKCRGLRRLVLECSPTAADRFSSHAPFAFDLSILDIHVCLKHGATLVLIGETSARMRLASPAHRRRADLDLVLGAIDPGAPRAVRSLRAATTPT
jgi:hypothetical protein